MYVILMYCSSCVHPDYFNELNTLHVLMENGSLKLVLDLQKCS